MDLAATACMTHLTWCAKPRCPLTNGESAAAGGPAWGRAFPGAGAVLQALPLPCSPKDCLLVQSGGTSRQSLWEPGRGQGLQSGCQAVQGPMAPQAGDSHGPGRAFLRGLEQRQGPQQPSQPQPVSMQLAGQSGGVTEGQGEARDAVDSLAGRLLGR